MLDFAHLPEIKFIIEIFDKDLVASGLLMATINMHEISVNSPNNVFFNNYVVKLECSLTEISTSSFGYFVTEKLTPPTRNVYYWDNVLRHRNDRHGPDMGFQDVLHIEWDLMEKFKFDCSVSFGYKSQKSKTVKNCEEQTSEAKCSVNAPLFGNEKYSDFIIIVRNKEFKVHKCLLATASNVFDTMFSCGLDETKFGTANIDCDPVIFNHLLSFIYTGLLPTDDMSEICVPLFELAECYNITSLMKTCLKFILETEIDRENALDLYKLASTYDIKELLEDTWQFIKL